MQQQLKLSVIVCSYNRAKYIGNVIQKLCDQTADKQSYETIIIDNNSTDETPSICKAVIEENPTHNIRYIPETKQGLTFARNRGIAVSNSSIISFIDDDGLCDEHYVTEILKAFDKYPKVGVIGGKVIPIFPECDPPKWTSKYIEGILSKLDMGDQEKPFNRKYPIGCNMAYQKSVFDKFGGFNEDLVLRSDEKDLFLRLKKTDTLFMYIPSIYVEHVMSKKRLAKQGVIKVSKITGEGEYYRSKPSILKLAMKFFEYILKFLIAVALSAGFFVRGKTEKARYILYVRYYILYGFLNAKKTFHSNT